MTLERIPAGVCCRAGHLLTPCVDCGRDVTHFSWPGQRCCNCWIRDRARARARTERMS